jgi:hypothetical protein
MSEKDNKTHPIDLVERVRLKIAFLTDIDDRSITHDGDQGLCFLLLDMNEQLQEAVKRLNEMTICTGTFCRDANEQKQSERD